ncbi:HD domain-containing protein [Marinobacterium sp. D7]|uniref:HD domain-containing phosphohydrolase n=1 Tax=Marinobacterium ramblicola TaxID=2849041 RepID=UPI001C2CE879|nr:HD domain-containing phosphohydrolase [Marinobacterium ramblicola]MBV1788749.1 HD domain-containing protein [Marinobacterium ramblicola]
MAFSSPSTGGKFRIPLSARFLLFAITILLVNGLLMIQRSDEVMEEAFLSETNAQLGILLQSLGRNLELGRIEISDPSLAHESKALNDSQHRMQILELYIFDSNGHILANSSGDKTAKPIRGEYAKVIHQRRQSLGEKYEWDADHETVKADYMVPIDLPDGRIAGLEAEVNLTGIKTAISHFDGPFEQAMWYSILISSILMLLTLGALVHLRLTGPIQRLHATVRALSSGRMETRIQLHQKDEIGELGQGINHLAQSVQELLEAQEQSYIETLQSLAQALEAKDPYTAKHSGRVSRFAVRLGQRIGLDEQELSLLKRGALMHDLGKIGIPDGILNKPSALNDDEYQQMRRHPTMTASIMKPLSRFRAFAEIAAWHHERWDGQGYPDGLAGEEIPLLARIVAIADTWDAMTGDRVYRKGMSAEIAISILERERHQGQFDPELIVQFIDMVREDLKCEDSLAAEPAAGSREETPAPEGAG